MSRKKKLNDSPHLVTSRNLLILFLFILSLTIIFFLVEISNAIIYTFEGTYVIPIDLSLVRIILIGITILTFGILLYWNNRPYPLELEPKFM